jgi:CheY-like chemotaxis protein
MPHMARVVIATRDPDVQTLLDICLHAEGHTILEAGDDQQAQAALSASRQPAVVVLHAPVSSAMESIVQILNRVAADSSGRLTRHRFIVLMPEPAIRALGRLVNLARLHVRAIEVPFDLEAMEAAVADAERELDGPHDLLELRPYDP